MHLRGRPLLLGLPNKLISVSSTPSSLSLSLSTAAASSSWELPREKDEAQLGLIPSDPQSYAHLLVSLSKQLVKSGSRHPFDEKFQRTCGLQNCKILHARVVKLGFPLAGKLGNGIVDLYSKSGNLVCARNAFNSLAEHDGMAWNSILSAHSRQGSPEEVIWAFGIMRNTGASPDQFTFAIVLSSCGRLGALGYGKQVHCDVIKTGFLCSSFCEGSLIDMYAKCYHLDDARQIFDGVRHPDTISWTALIAGYARSNMCDEALELFARMQDQGCMPDQVTFVTAITACVYLGRLKDARDLFSQMPSPNDIAWNAVISGHSQNGQEAAALGFYRDMRGTGIKPTRSTLGSVLSAAANLAAFDEGRQVHSEAIILGLDTNVFVGSSLMNMYSKCCSVEDARKVFDKLVEQNLITWNAMLGGYLQNGQPENLFNLFHEMKSLGLQPDEYTYVSLFGACAGLEKLDFGRQLHSVVIKNNIEESLFVGNALVDMYAKSEEVDYARQQFELIPDRDTVSWNVILIGYSNNNLEGESLRTFSRMRLDDLVPDEVSFATIISACVKINGYDEGKQVHCLSIKFGLEASLHVGSSLVDFYGKLGEMEAADRIFAEMPERSVVSWNALIAGFVQNNNAEEALKLFGYMLIEGIKPSHVTYASIIPACTGPLGLQMGRQLHCHTLKSGVLGSDVFLDVALIGMYSKSQCHEDANRLFLDVPNNNSTVLWTSIISGHAQNGYSEEAFQLFCKMHGNNIRSDQATFACVLCACADLASLNDGKEVHGLIICTGFESDEYTGSALIDMYSKCGEIGIAFQVFNELENKEDIISWNSMIVGFAKNGFAEEALLLFCQMLQIQRQPDDITFLGVLTACSHTGLVSEGRSIFGLMPREYGIKPRVDHYTCMIDLLGRGGHLKEAEELIEGLPFEPDSVVWATYLSACKMHGDGTRGALAAEKLIKLEPNKSSPYVLLSNIYAALGNWKEFKMVRETMKERGVRKLPGRSWIKVGNRTSTFVAGDKFHPSAVDIYASLKALTAVIKEEGYAVEFNCLLQDDE